MSLMVSISGVRGVVGKGLTPDVVVKYASAFAEYCQGGTVVIGRDGRITGKIIGNLVASTLLSMGCDVVALGIVPTPTIQIATEKLRAAGGHVRRRSLTPESSSDGALRAAGGISITASHNPIEWNGLKFLRPDGMFLNAQENKKLWNIAEKGKFSFASWDKVGKHRADDFWLQQHIDMVVQLPYLKVNKIRQRKFKIVVDCINGAGGLIVPQLLKSLGCQVTELNCDVSGKFVHAPEPIPENLSELCRRVKKEKADLGIAVDPDVDRLVLITEKGEPFGEEYTITSIVKFILQKKLTGSQKSEVGSRKSEIVVVNLSTTRAVDDVAKKFGVKVIRTPVGEINVAQKMKEVKAIVGGEGSGGVILPELHYGRDAIAGIGLILQQLAEFEGTLSEFKTTLPQYSIVKSKIDVSKKNMRTIFDRLKQRHAGNGAINEQDGLKFDFADSWVHLRTSNTEPVIRIIAESRTIKESENLVKKFKKEINS